MGVVPEENENLDETNDSDSQAIPPPNLPVNDPADEAYTGPWPIPEAESRNEIEITPADETDQPEESWDHLWPEQHDEYSEDDDTSDIWETDEEDLICRSSRT